VSDVTTSPEPGSDEPGIHRIAYELSLRVLDQQERVVNDLRARTGTLLAASSLVASFLGGRGIDDGEPGILTGLALAAFAASVAASVYVLLPKPSLIFALRGTVLFEEEFADPGGLPETYRRLVYWLEGYRAANEPTIGRLFAFYRGATAAVLVQVILWSMELALS
jgi:hypothetical protein